MFCAVVRAGVRCCACALLGLLVARAPCPGVLLRRRGETPSLWRARLAPWRALLAPGCGPVRGSGVCARWGGGGFGSSPLAFPALSVCPYSPACPACPPSWYPLGWPWPDGWSCQSDMVFLSCRGAWAGFVLGAGCSCGVPRRLAPVHRCARSVCGVVCAVSWAPWLLFTGVHALRVVVRVRCPGPPGSCSPVCTLCVGCCVHGALGLLGPVHPSARSVRGVARTVSWASWLLFTGAHALRVVLCVRCPGPPGSCSPVCMLCVWCCVYGVLGLLAPVHRCARSVCSVACTVSWASWLLFTGVHALCVVLRVRCPWPPGSCSPVRTLCAWCCAYGVLGLLAPVHRCARPACGAVCTLSWASWLLFTGAHALRVVLRVRLPGPPGSCSLVCTFCVWCCVYGVLGLLAPVHRCAPSVCGVPCTVSWASWLLFTGAHALRVVLCVRCPGPPGCCSPVCTLCVWCCVYGVLGLLAPVHRCARSACGVVCTVSWASWLLFTGVHAPRVVLRVRCPGPPGSCSPVCTLCAWCCVYGVPGLLAPVHRCARSVCRVALTASWASWLLFTGVHALCVVLRVRCPGPPGSCSPVCTLCVWCCVHGALGLLAPVHRCARSVRGVACTASWAPWLLFTGVHALCVVLRVRRPGPPGSCSPVCTLCVWCCVYGVLGLLAPVHRCARSACGAVCTVSWASWLLFTGVHALRVVLRVRCPGPPGSCSPVCTLCVWCCVYGVLGPLAPVHRCVRSVCGVACTASWAFWLLFTGVHALCVVLRVRCPGPPGSCSPVCTLCVWCCVYGVLGLLAPVHRCARSVCVYGVLGLPAPFHRCARSVCGGACTASWASWLPFTGVHPLCVVVRVGCPGPFGWCSGCAHSVCGVVCTVSWASWLLFTGVHALFVVLRMPFGPFALVCSCAACCVVRVVSWDTWFVFSGVAVCCGVCGVRCAVLRVRCPGPPSPCSPVCVLGVLRGVCGVGVGACSRVPFRGSDVADSLFLLKHFSLHIASYGVLLILPVLDSLILATPKSKRVLMHAWRCMLFTRWFVDSLHFATPKSRRVCLMHS